MKIRGDCDVCKPTVIRLLLGLSIFTTFLLLGCGGGGGSQPSAEPEAVSTSFTSLLHRGMIPRPRALEAGAFWSIDGGVITKDGEPTFPIGIYYVSHYPDGRRLRLGDISEIAAAGFSMIHTPIRLDDRDFLDSAAANGLYVAVEFNEEPGRVVGAFREHPAVGIFSTFDDVDAPRTNRSPGSVRAVRSQVEAAAPGKLTMVSAAFPRRVTAYRDAASILGFQLYPIPQRSVTSVYSAGSAVSRAVSTGSSVYVPIVQAFSQDRSRLPSETELRSMAWQGLLSDESRGIFFYTFYDNANYVKANPSFWSGLKAVAQDLSRMAPHMAGAETKMLVTGNPSVVAKLFKKNGVLVVVAANLSGGSEAFTVGVSSGASSKKISGTLGGLGTEAFVAAE